MVRETSIECYRKIKEQGLLSQLRLEVYDVLYNYGPLTAGEMWSRFFIKQRQRSSISARFSELEEMGCVKVTSERPCGYTGKVSIAWDVTSELPRPLKKYVQETKNQKIKRLEKRISELENNLNIF